MPLFRFRVVTPDGRIKVGRYTAASIEEAKKQIEDSGLKIIELAPFEDQWQKSIALPKISTGFERINGYALAAVLAIIGLVWGLKDWRAGIQPVSRTVARGVAEMASQRFSSEIRVEALGQLTVPLQAQLVVDLPEVPYHISQPWQGSPTVIKLDFLAARTPAYALVQLMSDSETLAAKRIDGLLPSNFVQLFVGDRLTETSL